MEHSSITLRPQASNDQTFLFQLFTETHTKKLQLNTLPDDIAHTILKQQFHAQTSAYRDDYPDAQFFIIEQEGEAIGKLTTLDNSETIHIIDIAICESRTGQAIGTNLIKSIIETAIRNQKSVRLSVDELTGPVALYQKLGFKAITTTAGSISMQFEASTSN